MSREAKLAKEPFYVADNFFAISIPFAVKVMSSEIKCRSFNRRSDRVSDARAALAFFVDPSSTRYSASKWVHVCRSRGVSLENCH